MRKFLKWAKRIVLGLITFIVLLLIVGFVFERISRNDAEKINPDGSFAEVGDHRLHYFKKGNGGPTVVFETAFDPAGHLQWYNIQQELPTSYTSLSYDRAGILWSDRGHNPKSGEEIAEELEKANVPKPYILVGHSFGGTLVRFFVNKYPEDVAGVILVDSQCPNDEKYLSPELFKMVNQGLPGGFLKFANNFGLARLMFKNMFPKDKQYQYQNAIMPALLYKSADAVLEEQDQMRSIKKEASKINSFGDIPLYVLTAADEKRYDSFIKDDKLKLEMKNAWTKMQKDFLLLSTNSKQILVLNSGHYINQEQPKVIENAINDMIKKIIVPQ
jgi:pimeloyl-ACP methyl ester carboxylesterase